MDRVGDRGTHLACANCGKPILYRDDHRDGDGYWLCLPAAQRSPSAATAG